MILYFAEFFHYFTKLFIIKSFLNLQVGKLIALSKHNEDRRFIFWQKGMYVQRINHVHVTTNLERFIDWIL